MRHPFLLLALLAGAASALADKFEIRRKLDPPRPPPDPTWGQGGGVALLPPVPRRGRECPTCGLVGPLDWRTCTGFRAWADHRAVKTRRVTLDLLGEPVRRRR